MELLQGDCLELLDGIADESVDMVLLDPPYSSGGLFAGDRKKTTSEKYANNKYNGMNRFPDFSGDNLDQHSFMAFMRMVLTKCRRKSKPGSVCGTFIDWRNLAAMTDALQMAGWIWRGIVVWNKGNSRAIPGRFRNDCEYIVWGTNGPRPAKFEKGAAIYPGAYSMPAVPSVRKHHQTEKPVELLKKLVQISPEKGTVLDPFMGSGSTGVACVHTGRDFIGIELDGYYFRTAQERIQMAFQEAEKNLGNF